MHPDRHAIMDFAWDVYFLSNLDRPFDRHAFRLCLAQAWNIFKRLR